MDRHHRVVMRALSAVGAATIVIAALWSAGLPPSVWPRSLEDWIANHRTKPTLPAEPLTRASRADDPVSVVVEKKPEVSVVGTDSSTSKVPLPLYLLSAAPGRNFREGTAQIGTNIANPQTYSAGAVLANGTTLAEIHSDFVVLQRGDKSAKLMQYKASDGAAAHTEINGLLSVGGNQGVTPANVTTREVLTDYLRPSPVYNGEQLRGYQVYPGRKSNVFRQWGLQPGDVITAINGETFVDPTQAMQLFRQVTDGMAVIAAVERKGTRHAVTLDGALIVADQDATRNTGGESTPLSSPARK